MAIITFKIRPTTNINGVFREYWKTYTFSVMGIPIFVHKTFVKEKLK